MPVAEAKVEVETTPRISVQEPVKEPEVPTPTRRFPNLKWKLKLKKLMKRNGKRRSGRLAGKFREAAKKFEETTEQFSGLSDIAPEPEETVSEMPKKEIYFYRSRLGGLKDIAQNIDKTSRNRTLRIHTNAGLSLYKPINPFSLLHVVRSKQRFL